MLFEKKIRSFVYAFAGLKIAWMQEHNFRIQVVCAALAVLFGWLLGISPSEWTAVALAIGLVLTAETLNTALEELCDKFKSDPDPHIEKIKDLAAGAVFLASVSALVVGAIIFIPRIFFFLS